MFYIYENFKSNVLKSFSVSSFFQIFSKPLFLLEVETLNPFGFYSDWLSSAEHKIYYEELWTPLTFVVWTFFFGVWVFYTVIEV